MGGSLAGLNAAIFLQQRGWEVEIFERSRRPLEGRGAGIVLHPAVFRALRRDPAEISARATRLRYIDSAGVVASEQPCDYRFISYAVLHRELVSRIDPAHYHLGAEVVEFEQSEACVEIRLANRARARADLLVCADGVHSSARRRLLPDVRPEYAGYVGWRGVVAETELTEPTHVTFDGAITYCIVPNSHILVYPIPNPSDGSRLINWVWYRNVPEDELERLLTDRQGVRHPVSIGAGQVAEENLAELLEGARRTLPPQLLELVSKSAEPFVQVVLDINVPSMAFGRIALIGDAAFALRPHVAAGTAKAAEDAWTLAWALAPAADEVAGALRDWERGQLALGNKVTDRSRRSGVRSQFENDWKVGEPLPFGLHEPGDSLLSEIADTTLRSLT